MALLLTPVGKPESKAVLVASHYDSAVCSKGEFVHGAVHGLGLSAGVPPLMCPTLGYVQCIGVFK